MMDMNDSSTGYWLDIAETMDVQQNSPTCSWQDETVKSGKTVKDPICLFGQFVSAVISDDLNDIQPQSEFSTFVRDLCVKAPSVAQYLVQEILNHSKDDSQPQVQGTKELGSGTNSKRSSKRRKSSDPTYRLPRSSRTEPEIPRDEAEDSDGVSKGSSPIGDSSVTCQPSHNDLTIIQNSDSLMTESPLPKCRGDLSMIISKDVPQEVQGQSAAHSHTMPFIGSEPVLHQLKAMYSSDNAKRNAVYRHPSVAFDKATKYSQITISLPSPSEIEQQKRALPEIDGKASDDQATLAPSLPHGMELQETTLQVPTPSTPVRQIGRGFQSPLSDDQTSTPQMALFSPIVNREEVPSPLTEHDRTASPPNKAEITSSERIPSSLSRTGQQHASICNTPFTQTQQVDREQSLSTQGSPAILSSSQPEEAPALADMVAKAVHTIYEMSRHQEVPMDVHSRILTTIRPSLGETLAATTTVGRSDSMWITSSSTTWSASMWINMLEAGHARSKKATILNMIEWMGASEWYDAELQQAEKAPPSTKRGTPRKRLATVVLDKYLKEARDTTAIESPDKLASKGNEGHPSSVNSVEIQKRILDTRRKRLNRIFHRGRTLCKLIQMTCLGILFDPNIWNYAKGSHENIDKVAAPFQADPQKMDFLSILDEQVELLTRKGRPDLSRFFDSLDSHSIASSKEVSSLRAEYGSEREPVPQSCLDTAIERVVEGISSILGKHNLGDNDSIIVNDAVEFSCGIFNRLCSKERLNCWDIAAALEMTDRPMFVRLGPSVPLHKEDANESAYARLQTSHSASTAVGIHSESP